MISPATSADWLQALFLTGLLGALAISMRRALVEEAHALDDNRDMEDGAHRKAA
jgi:hypothetical protein